MIQMINTGILTILLIIWMGATIMSYDYYSTTENNRYKFKYWFIISFLNVFQLIIAIIKQYIPMPELSESRWLAFMIIDIFLLEIFIINLNGRKKELLIRIIFYLCLITDMATGNFILPIIEGFILIYLASKIPYPNSPLYFMFTFVLFIGMELAPYVPIEKIGGFTNPVSLFAGVIYSLFLCYGIVKFYKTESISESLKKKI